VDLTGNKTLSGSPGVIIPTPCTNCFLLKKLQVINTRREDCAYNNTSTPRNISFRVYRKNNNSAELGMVPTYMTRSETRKAREKKLILLLYYIILLPHISLFTNT